MGDMYKRYEFDLLFIYQYKAELIYTIYIYIVIISYDLEEYYMLFSNLTFLSNRYFLVC